MSPTSAAEPSPRAPALLACLCAGLAAALCESVHAATRDPHLGAAYLAACAGLVVGGSALLGALAQLLRAPASLALALWAAGAGAVLHGWLGALALALAWLAAVRAGRAAELPSAARGTLAGAFLSLAWICNGWLTPVIAAGKLSFQHAQLARHAVLFLALALAAHWLLARPRLRTLAAPIAASALALAALLSVSPRAWRGAPPLAQAPPAPASVTASGPDVLLIVLDTLRADHLSAYGYGRRTSPELERLLAERPGAVRYGDAYANASWTVPAHASLLTGQLPSVHGAEHSEDLDEPPTSMGIFPEVPTLVEGMAASGRATLAVFANPWLRQAHGISRGFATFDFLPPPAVPRTAGERLRKKLLPSLCAHAVKPHASAELVEARLLRRLDDVGARPWFALANFMDAHGPNVAPGDLAGTFGPHSLRDFPRTARVLNGAEENRRLMDRYDEQILGLDRRMGALFDALERAGHLDGAWVFVTSDHGESFGEHGVTTHGTALFEEQIHVPLFVFPPRGVTLPPPSGPVSQIDVAATIAAITGVPYEGPGRDLRAEGGASVVHMQRGPARFRVDRHGALAAQAGRAVLRWPWKLYALGEELRLYDVAADPTESRDLAAERPDLVAELQPLLPEPILRSATFAPASPQEQAEGAEAMRQLGY